MKKMLLAATLSLCVVGAVAPARAAGISPGPALVAGWDFSQYFADGLLSIDGATFTDTLGANYSSLIVSASNTFGAGSAAGAYGTLYLNGQFGSTAQPAGTGEESILPSQVVGSLTSNQSAPVPFGVIEFESFTVLDQEFTNEISMTALSAGSMVFGVSSPLPGSDWRISFGGRTQPAIDPGVGQVEVQFSADGADYATRALIQLTDIDTPYEVLLSDELLSGGFVRFNFSIQGPRFPLVDNVAITSTLVPEPGTALLLLSGLAGLTAFGRRNAR
jgi:hypothetical protein